jgi:NADPH:quinone reductase-like Zn-dependent oxidoreductase
VRGLPYVLRLMGARLLRPKSRVPGTDVAGQVEAVGEDVTLFRPGSKVFSESVRGHQRHNGGAFAKGLARALASKGANYPCVDR